MHTWKGNKKSLVLISFYITVLDFQWMMDTSYYNGHIILLIYVIWLDTDEKIHTFWNPKHTFFFGCFNWMIQNPLHSKSLGSHHFPPLKDWLALEFQDYLYTKMKAGSFWPRAYTTKTFQGCLAGAISSLSAIAKQQQVPKVPQGQLGGSSQLVSHG